MEIKGKRILITCREDDSRPFYFLSSTYKCNFLGADNKQ